MPNDKPRQSLNVCFAVAQPVVAALTQLEITGPSIGEISDRYPTYVVPAGYAFTIWSLIQRSSQSLQIWPTIWQTSGGSVANKPTTGSSCW